MQNVFFFQWSHERLKPIGLEVNILLKRAVTVHNLGALSPMTSHGSNFGAAWDCLVSPDGSRGRYNGETGSLLS